MNKLYCIEKCTTCKAAREDLQSRGIAFEEVDLKTSPPGIRELTKWIKQHPRGLAAFLNTSGILYRELNMKEKRQTLSEKEILRMLSKEGMLIKRPILVTEAGVLVGYKKEMYADFFESEA